LYDGDIVHRHLLAGEPVLFNRQPTLHRMSMMCHFAKILKKGDTFRLNVADTKPYNADFDGDEMNMKQQGSRAAKAEMINYSVVEDVLPASGSRGSYCINYVNEYAVKYISKEDTLSTKLFYEAWEITPPAYKRTYFDRLNKLTRGIKRDDEKNDEKNDDRLTEDYFILNRATPNQLFSVLFPPTFNYKNGNLLIIEGIIVSGKIDTGHVTNSPTSIQVALYK